MAHGVISESRERHVPSAGHPKPAFAIIMNSTVPYNVHLSGRLARELTKATVHSVFTVDDGRWQEKPPAEANPYYLSQVEGDAWGQWSGFNWKQRAAAERVFDHLQRNGVQAVVQNGYASLFHLHLISRFRRAGIPVFLRGDSNILGEGRLPAWKARAKGIFVKQVLKRVAGVMAMSEVGRQYFAKYGADMSRCFMVPHEPDYDKLAAVSDEEVAQFRTKHRLPHSRKTILSLSRLAAVKRIDLIIDAFAAIADERPEWDLVIAGDGPERESLEARVPGRLSERVRWLGFCQPAEARLAYHAADAYVLASSYEPFAVTVCEAFATGLVTVASDVVAAARELVVDGENGRLFPSGDLSALTAALNDCTSEEKFPSYQQQVGPALARWRRDADPVEGIRQALQSVGVIA